MKADPLAGALALALTGQPLAVASTESLAEELAAQGYPPKRLAVLRQAAQAREERWPFPVPIDVLREVGFARFDAALARARAELGLTGLISATTVQRPPGRDEQRLLAERPPHW